jgi:hypothetical protein
MNLDIQTEVINIKGFEVRRYWWANPAGKVYEQFQWGITLYGSVDEVKLAISKRTGDKISKRWRKRDKTNR